MWRKTDQNEPHRERGNPSSTTASPPPAAGPAISGDRATIGPSISIRGDVTGEEDLVIQGRIEGKVDLKQHNVTVGKKGRVKADIYGKTLTIEGSVEGNLFGEERIVVRQAGSVIGNLTAPRVTLEDGATFKGNIDMEVKAARTVEPPRRHEPAAKEDLAPPAKAVSPGR
jgi:cytoskeletal protein CcmA (bactofilin family)